MNENETVRVLVVDDDRPFRDSVRDLLELESWIELVGMAGDTEEAISSAVSLSPDVVLLDYFLPSGTGAQVAERLTALLPDTTLIMMSMEARPDVMRPSMLSGAKDFLVKPFGAAELYTALQRVGTRRPVAEVDLGPATATAEGAEIVTVHSPKGGCGVTTIAVNLAVSKRLATGSRVALVDLSLAYGEVGLLMDLQGSANIHDLSQRASELDAALLADVLVTHPSGVKVLLAPSQPQQAEAVGGAQIRRILSEMANHFDYIFVDTSHELSEPVLVALDMARTILLVGTQDVAAVRDVKLFMDVVNLLGYPADKVQLVLNRTNGYTPLSPDAIQQRLGTPIKGTVPEELKPFSSASNRGVPVIIGNRRGAGTRELVRLASSIEARQPVSPDAPELSGPGTPKAAKKSRFSLGRA